MDPRKMQILEELIEHLGGKESAKFKSALDEERNPKPLEEEKPEGMEIEIVGKPEGKDAELEAAIKRHGGGLGEDESPVMEASEGEDEMSDEELKEMLEKYMAKNA